MIICHCFNVSDREIRLAIALGAADLEAVGDACGAGLCCGSCHAAITEMLAEMTRKLDINTQSKTE